MWIRHFYLDKYNGQQTGAFKQGDLNECVRFFLDLNVSRGCGKWTIKTATVAIEDALICDRTLRLGNNQWVVVEE